MSGGDRERLPLPVLRGRQVVLRPAQAADAPAVERVLATPDVARWWPIDGPDEVLALCAGDEPHLDVWVVELDGDVVGVIQAWEEPDPQYRHAGIDLALHPGVHGRGLGPEAIRLVARHLFDDRGHHRITIDPNAANTAAIRAYTKVGFRPVGVMRQVEWDATLGRWTDGLLMDLLRHELPDEPTDDPAVTP